MYKCFARWSRAKIWHSIFAELAEMPISR
ncbi:hypothetical protein CE195_12475, partial [Sodalis-like symbiont of Philaenus spumarius]